MLSDLPPFPGFRAEGLQFLRDLKEHNDRAWFKPRKSVYDDEVQWPLRCLVADAGRRAQEAKLPFAGDPKGGLFRIYRDTRFSKNKAPYKTHASAVLSPSGSRKAHGVYVHIEPGASFLAAGFWKPETAVLRAWRMRMAADPGSWLDVVERLGEADLAVSSRGDDLKRMPRGLGEVPDEVAPYVRWKSFIVNRAVDDARLQRPAFTGDVVGFMRDALPLLTYGWAVERPGATG